MDIRRIRRKLNDISQNEKSLKAFLAQPKPLVHKFVEAISSKYINKDGGLELDYIMDNMDNIIDMLTRNFATDDVYEKNPLMKLHHDAPVFKLNNNELVRTGWTRTIGGRLAEYCRDHNGEYVNYIDITDIIKNNDICKKLILAFNTGYVKTSFKGKNGDWVSLSAEKIIANVINSSRNNLGKLMAVAYALRTMKDNGYILLAMKTGHWSSFYEGNYLRFSSEDGDVPADRIVLPFVRIENWNNLNARMDQFLGSIEEHYKFMGTNAEKHSKYLYSDYYDLHAEGRVLVINIKDIKDEETRARFARMDGACFAHYRNEIFKTINEQISNMCIDADFEHMASHMIGSRNMAMQIRGSVKTVLSGSAPKATHMPKGVMTLWKTREFNNIVGFLVRSNPELADVIDQNTIIMTDDVAKKVPAGLFIMNIRINSFEVDKNDDHATFGYLGNTRTMAQQMWFEAIRKYDESNGKATYAEIISHIDDSNNMNWVVKKAMRGYQNMIEKLTKKSGIAITPEEAYNNINALLLEVADRKVVDDIEEDSNDARFLGFNDMMSVLRDISLTLSMVGKKSEVVNFDEFYSKMLESIIRSAFRVKLTNETCGNVIRGYLIPADLIYMATNGKVNLVEGTFISGKNLKNSSEFMMMYRQPILWNYGMAPFRKSKFSLTTKDYDISYIGGIVLSFGKLSPSGMQADFDGDTVYGVNAFGFMKHNNKDHIKFETVEKYYNMFWNNLLSNADGHGAYVSDGIEVAEDLCFNLAKTVAAAECKKFLPRYTNIAVHAAAELDETNNKCGVNPDFMEKYGTLSFKETLAAFANDFAGYDVDEETLTITSTMYRETLGQSIGLGDTKFSIATSLTSMALVKSMVAVTLFNDDPTMFHRLDMIAARMAAYLQAMIGAIKHNDKPMISVDYASAALLSECSRLLSADKPMSGLVEIGDTLSRIRKGRFNKFTERELHIEGNYSFKIMEMPVSEMYTEHFTHLDRMVLTLASSLHKHVLSLHKTYETVVANDVKALYGGIGGILVQKLLGGSAFDEANKVLYPDTWKQFTATEHDAAYNLPHRMTIAHAIVNYVGTVSRVESEEGKIGTASVIKILRDRILGTIEYIKKMQSVNDATFEKFVERTNGGNLYDMSANYYQMTDRVGNIPFSAEELLKYYDMTVDPTFAAKYDAVNAKVSAGKDLTEEENVLWLDMQLRIKDALPSNISTFKGVFGALVNKGFKDEVFAYVNSKLATVASTFDSAKSPSTAINHRKTFLGLDYKLFAFELLSSLFVMACTSGNKSLFMLLGTRLTKFFMNLYDVEFIGAARLDGKIVPMQILEYIDEYSIKVTALDSYVNENGKTNYKYKLIGTNIDFDLLKANFYGVDVDINTAIVTTGYKHIDAFIAKLDALGIKTTKEDVMTDPPSC